MKFWEAMKALEEGKSVEHRGEDSYGNLTDWRTTIPTSSLMMDWEYRLKPDETWKAIRHWKEGGRIQVRYEDEDHWGDIMSRDYVVISKENEYRIHPDEAEE